MKAIMYHYVRADDPKLPFFRHIKVENFVKQLNYFGEKYGYISKDDFLQSISTGIPAKGVLLTFDDGLKDHYIHVLPELLQRDLWGIFFIPTAPFYTGKLIDVHRIHMLLGKYGGKLIADNIRKIITDEMLSHQHIEEFHSETYKNPNNDLSTNYAKRLLNYFIDYKYRPIILDQLMFQYYPDEIDLVTDLYMTNRTIRNLPKRNATRQS